MLQRARLDGALALYYTLLLLFFFSSSSTSFPPPPPLLLSSFTLLLLLPLSFSYVVITPFFGSYLLFLLLSPVRFNDHLPPSLLSFPSFLQTFLTTFLTFFLILLLLLRLLHPRPQQDRLQTFLPL